MATLPGLAACAAVPVHCKESLCEVHMCLQLSGFWPLTHICMFKGLIDKKMKLLYCNVIYKNIIYYILLALIILTYYLKKFTIQLKL